MMKKYTASLNKLNIYVLISAGVHKSWAAYLMKTKNEGVLPEIRGING